MIEIPGIEKFRFHDLRHHFASRLVQSGIDLNTVRELLGHADITMVPRYAHMSPDRSGDGGRAGGTCNGTGAELAGAAAAGIRGGRRITRASMIGGVILASPLVTWQERLRWHILLYMPALWRKTMQRKAKLFMNNRSQAVRLPKEFQFNATEVFIRRHGDEVILSPRPVDWTAYLVSGPVASKEFMEAVDDLRVQEREL